MSDSNHVTCINRAAALEVMEQCHAEGFKVVASQNLNGAGWVVEYWAPKHNGHVIQWRKLALRKAVAVAEGTLVEMHKLGKVKG